jgi:hypothetical protein
MPNPLKNLVQTLPPEMFHDLKVRLVLLSVFGASVGLVVWSIGYRLPASDQKLQAQNTKITQLESETEQLERRWNPQEAERIADRFKQSQELLFSGQAEIGPWQAELKRQADSLTVSINTGTTITQACSLPGKRFAIIPATVDVRPIAPGIRTNSPYLRLLNLAQNLSSQNKRVDLVALAATGSSNSVSEAKMELQLWSLENSP